MNFAVDHAHDCREPLSGCGGGFFTRFLCSMFHVFVLKLTDRIDPQPRPSNCFGNDEFCIYNDEFCIMNDGLCIENDGFCIKNDGFCIKNDRF